MNENRSRHEEEGHAASDRRLENWTGQIVHPVPHHGLREKDDDGGDERKVFDHVDLLVHVPAVDEGGRVEGRRLDDFHRRRPDGRRVIVFALIFRKLAQL